MEIRARAGNARGHQNSRLPARKVRRLYMLDEAGGPALEMAVRKMGLSARAHDRILKVPRTMADLPGSESASPEH